MSNLFSSVTVTELPTVWKRCWLVGCFGFNGPLRQYFSLYRAVSQREGEGRERIDESKNVQTTPTRTYCKGNRPLPYCNQNCRTPRHWKFTQHHRTTRPPPFGKELPTRIVTCNFTACLDMLSIFTLYFGVNYGFWLDQFLKYLYIFFNFLSYNTFLLRIKMWWMDLSDLNQQVQLSTYRAYGMNIMLTANSQPHLYVSKQQSVSLIKTVSRGYQTYVTTWRQNND